MKVTEQQFKKALDASVNCYLDLTFKDIINKSGSVIVRKIIFKETNEVFGFIVNKNKYFLSGC